MLCGSRLDPVHCLIGKWLIDYDGDICLLPTLQDFCFDNFVKMQKTRYFSNTEIVYNLHYLNLISNGTSRCFGRYCLVSPMTREMHTYLETMNYHQKEVNLL